MEWGNVITLKHTFTKNNRLYCNTLSTIHLFWNILALKEGGGGNKVLCLCLSSGSRTLDWQPACNLQSRFFLKCFDITSLTRDSSGNGVEATLILWTILVNICLFVTTITSSHYHHHHTKVSISNVNITCDSELESTN